MPQYAQSSQNPFAGSPRGGNYEYWLSTQPQLSSAQGAAQASGRRLERASAAELEATYGPPSGGGGLLPLMEDYRNSEQEAKLANLQRYANLLERGEGRVDFAMGLLGNMGSFEAGEAARRAAAQRGLIDQKFVGSGLRNNTVAATAEGISGRQYSTDMARLQDQLRSQALGSHERLSGDIMGVMERRTDDYPDYAQMLVQAQLAGQAGAYGGGGYGGGGYGGGYVAAQPMMAGGGAYGSPYPQYQMPMQPFTGGGGAGGYTQQNQFQTPQAVQRWEQAATERYGGGGTAAPAAVVPGGGGGGGVGGFSLPGEGGGFANVGGWGTDPAPGYSSPLSGGVMSGLPLNDPNNPLTAGGRFPGASAGSRALGVAGQQPALRNPPSPQQRLGGGVMNLNPNPLLAPMGPGGLRY